MSEPKDSNDSWGVKDILGGVIGGGLLSVLGIWMIINPDGMSSDPSAGRRRMLKDLLNAIWGIPGGIIVGLIGIAIVWATVHQAMKQMKGR